MARTYYDLENTLVYLDKSKFTIDVKIDHTYGYAGFESVVGSTAFKGCPKKWDANEFVFKTGSEHTLEGKWYDLELQIVHVPHVETEEENKKAGGSAKQCGQRRLAEASSASGDDSEDFKSAFISILFSISDYDEVSLDIKERFINFFNDLHFERENPVIDKVQFGELMQQIDMSNRWIYKGSRTKPPCDKYVYWNVIDKFTPFQ